MDNWLQSDTDEKVQSDEEESDEVLCLRKEIFDIQAKNAALARVSEQITERNNKLQRHIEKTQERTNAHKSKAEELQKTLDQSKNENDSLQKEVDELQKKLESKNKTLNDLFQQQKKETEHEKLLTTQQHDLQAHLTYLEKQIKKHKVTSNTEPDVSWSAITDVAVSDLVLQERAKDLVSLIIDRIAQIKDLKSRLSAIKADSATHEELSQIQIKQLVQQVTGAKSPGRSGM